MPRTVETVCKFLTSNLVPILWPNPVHRILLYQHPDKLTLALRHVDLGPRLVPEAARPHRVAVAPHRPVRPHEGPVRAATVLHLRAELPHAVPLGGAGR